MVRCQEFCMFYIYMEPFLKGMPQPYLREVTLLGHSTVFNYHNRSFVSLYSQIIIAKMKQIGTFCHLTVTICIEEHGDFDEH